MTSGDVTGDSITKSAYIVASDDPAITDIFDLHIDGETVPYPGKGEVLLTEKLAELTDIKTGDTVTGLPFRIRKSRAQGRGFS